jgi:hypothetical protein
MGKDSDHFRLHCVGIKGEFSENQRIVVIYVN